LQLVLARVATERSELITITLFFALTFLGLNTDLFVILFQGLEIFTLLTELTFFHTFTNVPVDESTLGVHQVEFVVDPRHDLLDGGRVRKS
jgi:hypothetical protein